MLISKFCLFEEDARPVQRSFPRHIRMDHIPSRCRFDKSTSRWRSISGPDTHV